ncbi:MAG: hypothetical protein D6675_01600 [Gemmatimonadetes bacterium]|nr:MAG: hypothetical protein D6675_01600 [Gemmatimonadota bacterium]
MLTPEQHQQFKEKGYIVVRQLLSEEKVQEYLAKLEERSGIRREDFTSGKLKTYKTKKTLYKAWTLPDGVAQTPDFWEHIFNEKLLGYARALLGDDIRFLQHNDLHVGFSAVTWHRDSVTRKFGEGDDWDESEAPYKLLRCGVYLQKHAESDFKLGLIPGSHRYDPVNIDAERKKIEKGTGFVRNVMSVITGNDPIADKADWIATEPGDCIIFDPRVIHSGSYIKGPKYSIFVGYGVENKHFYNHWNYYLNIRKELNYKPFDPKLVEQLKAHNLYPNEMPNPDQVAKAWVPSNMFKFVASKIK